MKEACQISGEVTVKVFVLSRVSPAKAVYLKNEQIFPCLLALTIIFSSQGNVLSLTERAAFFIFNEDGKALVFLICALIFFRKNKKNEGNKKK